MNAARANRPGNADAMTLSHLDTADHLYHRLRQFYGEDEVVKLTAVVALENFRSNFNHALRIPAQGFWRPQG